ncbi:uncharacterized protein LOC125648400 isoform X14 [Ostrea edulis]|uniref:uncharacterized protein LOC125648400 isoform X14 n=1 Tax=Ostrea edulis TaxID=37623 RepID=UPI0024AF28FA|nr:uncharacterized protein LOC125648400 isoform X14 [Ostrea edulis]
MKTRQVSSAPLAGSPLSSLSTSSSSLSFEGIPDEVTRLSEEKSKNVKGGDETVWKEEIRKRMEDELNARVREALETPPLERAERQRLSSQQQQSARSSLDKLNSHLLFELNDKNHAYLKARKWRALQAKKQMQNLMRMNYTLTPAPTSTIDVIFKDKLSKSNQDEFPGVFGLQTFSEGIKDRNSLEKYPSLKQIHRQFYTKEGFLAALNSGHFPDGSKFDCNENGAYKDRFGVIRDQHGPFWPGEWGPLFPTPRFQWFTDILEEPLFTSAHNQQFTKTFDNQQTPYTSKWRGVLIVYDSERSSRDHSPQPVPDGCCPNLVFESRFESGNLRQARRVGQCEYELVLKTDLYTNRHTQWYYFRIQNAVPGLVYKFRIVNLLKRDSLYNYGMRPLLYSEKDAKDKSVGWIRAGHHISYSRNVMHLHCPLLMRGIPYYELEWQMEFPNAEDTFYLAHCYPYTFTDLKEDLDAILNNHESRKWIKREVLCETRAGNSCFLVTCTNFDTSREEQIKKKVVVVTARVHPGESQASWMMKGLLDFITSGDPVAKELRNRFIFKVVPMLNPDGVIVGNYRCSLAARDLNRNYRHPRKESFPTVWFTKSMMEKILERHDIVLYCDLHGHSRKHNVFMYGNNTSEVETEEGIGAAQAYLRERLFPWLMSQRSPDKFSFPSCKFQIKRCKESTGRVVMWRQMRVLNSFTLEATFSGTILNRKELRHFNIGDFMEMGRVLSQVVLDYEVAQESKSKQTEVVLDMTRYITNQVLEQRGMIGASIPNLHSLSTKNGKNSDADSGIDASQDNTPVLDGRQSTIDDHFLYQGRADSGDDSGRKTEKKRKADSKSHASLSRKEVDTLIDKESLKTMDGCLKILSDLNVREALQESDSSDSDSESEPEMKAADSKPKKKKRKSKKQRDKEHQERKGGSGSSDKKQEERSKSLTALPSISCSDAQHDALGNPGNLNKKLKQNRRGTIASRSKVLKLPPQISPTKHMLKLSTIIQQSDNEEASRETLQLSNMQIEFNDAAVGKKGGGSNVSRTESKRMLLLKMQEDFPASQNSTRKLKKNLDDFFTKTTNELCSSQRHLTSLDFSRSSVRNRYSKYTGLMDTESFLQSPYQDYENIVGPICMSDMSKSGNETTQNSEYCSTAVHTKSSVGTKRKSTTFRLRRSFVGEVDTMKTMTNRNTKLSQGKKQTNLQRQGLTSGLPSSLVNRNSTREGNEQVLMSYVNNEEITLKKHQRKGR